MRPPYLLILMSILLTFYSCSKETECTYRYRHVPATLAFIGYAKEELDSIVVDAYRPNGAFDSLVGGTILKQGTFVQLSDTMIFRSAANVPDFKGVTEGYEYEVSVSTTGTRFRITDITYSAQDYTYTTKNTCPQATYGLANPARATINNRVIEPFFYNPTGMVALPVAVYALHR